MSTFMDQIYLMLLRLWGRNSWSTNFSSWWSGFSSWFPSLGLHLLHTEARDSKVNFFQFSQNNVSNNFHLKMCLSLLPKTSRICVRSCLEGKLESCLHFRKNNKMSTQLGKILWRKEWQPTLVSAFLPGEFHGQRSLVGYSPWGGKESDTTE